MRVFRGQREFFGNFGAFQSGNFGAVKPHATGVGAKHSRNGVEGGRFANSGRPHDCDCFVLLDVEIERAGHIGAARPTHHQILSHQAVLIFARGGGVGGRLGSFGAVQKIQNALRRLGRTDKLNCRLAQAVGYLECGQRGQNAHREGSFGKHSVRELPRTNNNGEHNRQTHRQGVNCDGQGLRAGRGVAITENFVLGFLLRRLHRA